MQDPVDGASSPLVFVEQPTGLDAVPLDQVAEVEVIEPFDDSATVITALESLFAGGRTSTSSSWWAVATGSHSYVEVQVVAHSVDCNGT